MAPLRLCNKKIDVYYKICSPQKKLFKKKRSDFPRSGKQLQNRSVLAWRPPCAIVVVSTLGSAGAPAISARLPPGSLSGSDSPPGAWAHPVPNKRPRLVRARPASGAGTFRPVPARFAAVREDCRRKLSHGTCNVHCNLVRICKLLRTTFVNDFYKSFFFFRLRFIWQDFFAPEVWGRSLVRRPSL